MTYTPAELVINKHLTDIHLICDEGHEIIKALDAAGYVILPKTATKAMEEALWEHAECTAGKAYQDMIAAYLKETGQTSALPT